MTKLARFIAGNDVERRTIVTRQRFTATLLWQGGIVTAQCREAPIATQGETEEEALTSLREALALQSGLPLGIEAPEIEIIVMKRLYR